MRSETLTEIKKEGGIIDQIKEVDFWMLTITIALAVYGLIMVFSASYYFSISGKLSSGHRTGKRSVFIPIPKNGNAKECSNYCTIALISHASKVMLKILQARLQQYDSREP